jgi:ubiquinone/menaquinone biosynthesis C-methylase UbiE
VRTDYEQLAARYDDDRARWSFPRDDVIDELLTSLASRSTVRVLDLGCGTGRWLAAQRESFVDATVEWLGVDPSSAMLAEASAKGIANLLRSRAEDLPLPDATIDYIASSYAFHHFSDKERALDEVHRVLTKYGVLRVNNIEPAAAEGWWLYEFFPEAMAIDAARFWPASRVGEALQARQFSVDINLDAGPREIPAAEALTDAERRVVSQLALLDDAAYARGLARLREAAAPPEAILTTTRSRLRLTARRTC